MGQFENNYELVVDLKARARLDNLRDELKKMEAEVDTKTKAIEGKLNDRLKGGLSVGKKKEYEKDIQSLQEKIKSVNSQIANEFTNAFEKQGSKAVSKIKEIYSEMLKLQKVKIQGGLTAGEEKDIDKQMKSLSGKLTAPFKEINGYGKYGKDLQQAASFMQQSYRNRVQELQIEQRLSQESKQEAATKAESSRAIKMAYSEALALLKEQAMVQRQINDLEGKKNLTNKEKEQLDELKKQRSEISQQIEEKRKLVNEDEAYGRSLDDNTKRLQRQTERMKTQGDSVKKDANNKASGIGEAIGNVARYVALYKGLSLIEDGVRNVYDNIKELDKAFTDIQLVTGQTSEQIRTLSQDYNSLAKEMGATTTEVAEGAGEWLRQGKTTEETAQLLRSSMTLSKVGAIESSQATSLLTSTLNGYKLEAEDAMNVVDKISSIDLEAATSSEELALALSRTANSANDAGVSFDKLLGMIGTTSSVTRKSASTIGESFKTIFARMSNVAAGKDIDDEGESLNDVETTLNKMGIALRSSQNEWRNFEDVIDEVAGKWQNFTSTQQSQIATAIAGTRQQENLRAMFANWDEVQRLTNVAATSTGSATERMNIYLDSVEAKTNNLKAAWEGFIMSLNQTQGYKDFLDFLTKFVESLQHVNWGVVGIIAVLGTVLSILPKVVNAIKSIQVAIEETTLLAGLGSGGLTIILGLLVTAITAFGAAMLTANADVDKQIEDIQERKQALEEEKGSVEELYQEYSELRAKADYYSLTAEEKQKLVDISETLVEKYGLEANGVDTLTGSYNLANDALSKYLENLEKEKRVLSDEEEKATKKKAKGDLKDVKSAVKEKESLENKFGNTLVEGSEEDRKQSVKLFKELGVYLGKQSRGTLSREESAAKWNVLKQLKDLGFDEQKIQNQNYDAVFSEIQKLGISQIGTEISDDDVDKILASISTQYAKAKNKVVSETGELADDIQKVLVAKLGDDVPEKITDVIGNSLKTAFSDNNIVKNIKDSDKFIEDYSNEFVNIANANGENLDGMLSNFEELQKKLNSGNMGMEEYKGYQEELRAYIGLHENAAKAAGMDEEAARKFAESLGADALDNMNAQLFEFKENMDTAKNTKGQDLFTQEQKDNYGKIVNQIIDLNSQFKSGKMSAQDYYNSLQQFTTGFDLSNVTQQFGDMEHYVSTLSSILSDTTKNLSSIWTTFQGGGDSLEFLNSFLPAAKNAKDIAEQFTKIEETTSRMDLDTRDIDYNEAEDTRYDVKQSSEEIQQKIKQEYDVDVSTEDIDKAKEKLNELDGKSVDVAIEGLDDSEKGMENLIKQVDSVTDGTDDLKNNIADLGDALSDLESLDFGGVDKAFETVSKAFDDLPGNTSSLIGQASSEVESAAQNMAQWMINVANSDEAYAQTARDNIISTMATAGQTVSDIGTVSADSLAQSYLASAQNTANFAASANSIAQQAMSAAVQKLGAVLTAMGNAVANLNVEIPLSLDGLDANAKVGPLDIPISIPNIKTVFKIGGEGTKGLQNIGSAIADLGSTLSSPIVADTIASNFTPVQANYQPSGGNLGGSGGKGGSGSHTPSGGGGSKSGKGGGGGQSDADKAAEKAAELQKKINEFREDEGTKLEDVTEELIRQYETEGRRLELAKKNLEYASDLLDSEEDTTKWLEAQNKLLTVQRKQIQANYRENSKIQQQIDKIQAENGQYNINSWFDENGESTLAYKELLNSFAIQERDYRATVALNSEEDIENAKKHIEEIKKQREYVENLFDSVEKLKEAWNDNNEEIQDLITEMNDNLKEMRDTLLDKFMEQLEKQVDQTNQAYEDNITKLESLITIQERYNDVINDSLDKQEELRKELRANKDSYQYLDDYMRSIIFNEEDYDRLSGELDRLMSEMDTLAQDYQKQINDLTEDEMYKAEAITNEYERQVDLKQKEYELLEAELEVTKAQTKLQNALNERTVRMYVNGQWVWTADPEAVKDATEELGDAQIEKDRIEREKAQTEYLNELERQKDNNQMEIDLNEQLLEQIQDKIDELKVETKTVNEWLEVIAKDGVPMLHDIMAGVSDKLGQLLTEIGSDASLLTGATANTSDAIRQGILNGTLDPEYWGERLGWIKGDNGKWYAPKDDPLYDPSGFDFGRATPEVQSHTDSSGVQVTSGLGSGIAIATVNSVNKTFPRQGTVKNVSSSLNIRNGAGTEYEVIGKIPPSGAPQVLGENGAWAQVNYNGIVGWADKSYLSYDKGGLMRGKGIAIKNTLKPEYTLSPEQTKAWMKLVDNLTNPLVAQLAKTPQTVENRTDLSKDNEMVRDKYIFNGVTVQANNIEEFIDSIKVNLPINDFK